ncbi:MAG: GNAT family N-acetyltransferase [Verrucomicrobiota bacterium]
MYAFTIRRYQPNDVDGIYAAADESREHVGKWMSWLTSEYSRADAETWVANAISAWDRKECYEHVIVDSSTHTVVGACGLNRLNPIDQVCNLGYWVSKSYRGRGAALDAVQALKQFAFNELEMIRLEIVVAEGNHASYRVAEKSGALYEGLQQARLRVRGVSQPAHMFALIHPDIGS